MPSNRFDQSANDTGTADKGPVYNTTNNRRRLADLVSSGRRTLNLDRRFPGNERRVNTVSHLKTPARRILVDRRRILKGRRFSDHNGTGALIPVPGKLFIQN